MIDVERSIVIQRPVRDVFAFVSDLTNEPQFHTDVTAAKRTTEGPLGVGTVFELTPKPGSGVARAVAKVTRFEPDREIVFETEYGRMRPVRTYRVVAEGGGARVSHRLELQPTGMMRLMSFMMRRMVSTRWETFLGNLKRILEEPPAVADGGSARQVRADAR